MKKFALISHTHWDREWYKPFEAFRLKLVRLIDEVFAILEQEKEYIFHLDAQTVVLEDYLAMRPEKESLLKKYISSGNIIVGPWYLQNDFYLTSGEATVRNLLTGTRLARSFGKCSKVGYMPDQFGIVSSMPQILRGFQINSAIFGRGFMEYSLENGKLKRKLRAPEFIWKSKDGSEVLGVFLQRWYNNAQRLPEDKQELQKLLIENCAAYAESKVSIIPLMNGVDHLFPQSNVLQIIRSFESIAEIKQTDLDSYVNELYEFKQNNAFSFDEYEGALNRGTDYEILKGCWSSRIYLKQVNIRAQDLLENQLEPLYAYLELCGLHGIYPAGELAFIWKSLLKLHPHDNICGCSVDAVHRHMEDSFEKIEECGAELLSRGLEVLASHSYQGENAEDYLICAFNPTEEDASGVFETDLCVPVCEKHCSLVIVDQRGKEIPFEIVSRKKQIIGTYSDLNLPVMSPVCKYRLRILTEKIEPYASKMFMVRLSEKKTSQIAACSAFTDKIENEYYKIGWDSALYIIDKGTKVRLDVPIFIEDSADCGSSYVYRKDNSVPLVFKDCSFLVRENSLLQKSAELEFYCECPKKYVFSKRMRSEKKVKIKVTLRLTLRAASDVICIEYFFENKACDHRLRFAIKAGLENGIVISDEPFAFSERHSMEHCIVSDSDVHFNSTFISIQKDYAVEIYTEGQHEFEYRNGNILLTALRATGAITRDEITFKTGGTDWLVPDNQLLRKIQGRFGLRISAKTEASGSYRRAKQFRTGILSRSIALDPKKYLHGSAAVQASASGGIYLSKDPFRGVLIPHTSFIKWNNRNITVTAFKKREEGTEILIRLFNCSHFPQKVSVVSPFSLCETDLAENELASMGKNFTVEFTPQQLRTFLIKQY